MGRLCRLCVAVNRLDKDGFGELLADAQARIAHLADEIGLAAEKFDDLFLAQTHFAQSNPNFRGTGEVLDTNHCACLNAAQRANRRAEAFAIDDHAGLLFLRFTHRTSE